MVSLGNLYFTHFYGPDLQIQSFPSKYTGLSSYDISKDITFVFNLNNSGGKTAFVDHIFVYEITGSGNGVLYRGATIGLYDKFYVDPGKTEKINVTIPAPNAAVTNELKIKVC